jgi:hypothetical protein
LTYPQWRLDEGLQVPDPEGRMRLRLLHDEYQLLHRTIGGGLFPGEKEQKKRT